MNESIQLNFTTTKFSKKPKNDVGSAFARFLEVVIVGQHLGQEVDLQILRRGSVRHQPSLVPRPEDDAVLRKDLSGRDPTAGADDAAVAQLSRSTDVRLETEKKHLS